MYSFGIDIGSRTTKAVLLKHNEIVFKGIEPTSINPALTAKKLYNKAIEKAGTTNFKTVTTGYGRKIVEFSNKAISEISCHAAGVNFLHPDAKAIIDIGGQDAKVIVIDENGKVIDFAMNDKCAAGTGRFLEKTAVILETTLDKLSNLAMQYSSEIEVSSVCVVFAESEMIGLIAKNEEPANIAWGVHKSIAKRIKNLLAQVSINQPVYFTGGVANNTAMLNALKLATNLQILPSKFSSFTGALGAAILAKKIN